MMNIIYSYEHAVKIRSRAEEARTTVRNQEYYFLSKFSIGHHLSPVLSADGLHKI